MPLESLNCNNCGAPLSVPETANFIKCNHCAARRENAKTFSRWAKLGQVICPV